MGETTQLAPQHLRAYKVESYGWNHQSYTPQQLRAYNGGAGFIYSG